MREEGKLLRNAVFFFLVWEPHDNELHSLLLTLLSDISLSFQRRQVSVSCLSQRQAGFQGLTGDSSKQGTIQALRSESHKRDKGSQ